uniref:Uncharacterized protein n=1 Tax=Oryza meridionalis TaxID=40149 RepID=A0A0E0DDB4_9ORYZ
MSSEAPKGVDPMSGSKYDSAETLSDVPFIGSDADSKDEGNTSAMTFPLGKQPLDVAPLNAIPFNEVQGSNRKEVSRKEVVSIPQWLKEHKLYKDGDWEVSISIRATGQKDWSYHHREYQATIRSKPEVELFMETTLQNRTNIFKGRKLQKKWRMDSCAEGSTGGSKSTKRKKINSSTEKKKPLSIGNEPLKLTLPHGFV